MDLWNVCERILDLLNAFPCILYLIYLFKYLYCKYLILSEKALAKWYGPWPMVSSQNDGIELYLLELGYAPLKEVFFS
jgi:hypothetical protein